MLLLLLCVKDRNKNCLWKRRKTSSVVKVKHKILDQVKELHNKKKQQQREQNIFVTYHWLQRNCICLKQRRNKKLYVKKNKTMQCSFCKWIHWFVYVCATIPVYILSETLLLANAILHYKIDVNDKKKKKERNSVFMLLSILMRVIKWYSSNSTLLYLAYIYVHK